MRELALVTFRIVDETTRLQPEEVAGLYTDDYANKIAADNMSRLERPPVPDGQPGIIHETADGTVEFVPRAEMSVIRVEPCNPDSALGAALLDNEKQVVSGIIGKLSAAGERLLTADNDERAHLHDLSKTLGGDGVERTDRTQFYAVFDLSAHGDQVNISLEGILRLDKVDMAIDEAILIP